ncbi:hypothetical protein HDV63DRAFT_147024 [Trichoderma sp. SZMC 28014]
MYFPVWGVPVLIDGGLLNSNPCIGRRVSVLALGINQLLFEIDACVSMRRKSLCCVMALASLCHSPFQVSQQHQHQHQQQQHQHQHHLALLLSPLLSFALHQSAVPQWAFADCAARYMQHAPLSRTKTSLKQEPRLRAPMRHAVRSLLFPLLSSRLTASISSSS